MITRKTKPVGRFVVLEQVMHESSGIILDENIVQARDMYDFVVVDIGPDCKFNLKVNDIVCVSDGMMGYPVQDDRERHFVINESDIVGVVEISNE